MAKAQFQLQEGEAMLLDRITIMTIRGKLQAKQASLIITNQRIVLSETSMMWGAMFGLIGALIGNAMNKGAQDIRPEQVVSAAMTTHGINKQVIKLTTSDGNEVKLIVKPHVDKVVSALGQIGVQVQPAV